VIRGGKVGAWLEDVIEAADDDAWRRTFRGAVAVGDTATMQALARQAEALDQPPTVLDRLGNALWEGGLREQGLALWRQAQQRHLGDFWLNYDLGVFLPESGRPDGPEEAVGYCRIAVALRPVAGAYNALGRALYSKGDFDACLATFRQVSQLDPNAAAAHTNLGIALQAKGDVEGALDELRQAVQLDPQFVQAYEGLGRALQAKGDLDGAIATFRKAISLDPQSAAIHSHLGFALRAKGDLDGSIAAYRQATILNPQSALDHSQLGFSLRVKGDLDGSIDAYRQAIQLNPQSALEHNALGFVLQTKGDLDGAIAAYRQATILDPKSAPFHNVLGFALQAKGDLEGAVAAYRQAIYLDPNAVYIQDNLRAARQMQAELERKLLAFLRGERKPEPAECLELAFLCQQPWKQQFAHSARLYEAAFAARPELAEDVSKWHRYNAACGAALAAAGQGKDQPPLDDKTRARWRQQALLWLRADLAAHAKQLETGKPEDLSFVEQRLRHWQSDSDLAGLRDPAAGKLPTPEQQAWRKLWADVAALLQKARSPR
jgi:tetratricopeptide (TPR) repeat protein